MCVFRGTFSGQFRPGFSFSPLLENMTFCGTRNFGIRCLDKTCSPTQSKVPCRLFSAISVLQNIRCLIVFKPRVLENSKFLRLKGKKMKAFYKFRNHFRIFATVKDGYENRFHILRFDTVAFHNRRYSHYHDPSGLR